MTRRVLLVDDDDDLRALVSVQLRHEGFDVADTGDPSSTVGLARAHRPDAVVLDLEMPERDGWQVLDDLRDDPVTRTIPVVVLTGLVDPRATVKSYLHGAVDLVPKPFDRRSVADAIRRVVDGTDATTLAARRRAQMRQLAAAESGRPPVPTVQLTRLEAPPLRSRPEEPPSFDTTRLPSLQRSVAELLVEGLGPRAIGERLGITRQAVYAARARLAKRLGVAPSDVATTLQQR